MFSPQTVDQGIRQGSVNDLPHESNFNTTLFADDTNLRLSHYNINTLRFQVNQKINKINQWMISNKLTVTYKKAVTRLLVKKL